MRGKQQASSVCQHIVEIREGGISEGQAVCILSVYQDIVEIHELLVSYPGAV